MNTATDNVPVAARLPRDLADELRALASAQGRTVSDVLRNAVERTLTPRARRGDPSTSHRAARSVSGLSDARRAVLRVLTECGPMTDEQLATEYRLRRAAFVTAGGDPLPRQSTSGLRTRRAELCDLGLVGKVGETRLPSGRAAARWGVRA